MKLLDVDAASVTTTCVDCGTEIARGLLSCPSCHRLVHADALKQLSADAAAAVSANDPKSELAAWRSAQALVPTGSRQHNVISARIAALTDHASRLALPDHVPTDGRLKWLGALGAAGLLLWKFKFVLVFLASKGKLLLLGLTKASTFFSMALSVGVYWATWGLWFAGFVLSIYVHEMGHVAALKRFGHEATAPMFVPGLGAFIRLRAAHLSPFEDARIGLAGPWWGLGAAVVALVLAPTGGPMYLAIASTGAWLNLFNLLPVWQLDGNRGFSALSKSQRLLIAASFGAAWALTSDGLLVLLFVVALVRAFDASAPATGDRGAFGQFASLVVALASVFHFARV